MARYVLVEFDDNDEANNFVDSIRDGHVVHAVPDPEDPDKWFYENIRWSSSRVRAVWFKPTLFCECPNASNQDARGPKYGLWVHKGCGKPRKGICQHPRNLLDPIDMDVRYRDEYLGIYEPSERGGIRFERGDPPPVYKKSWK